MKKNIDIKIHTVPQKSGYYRNADDFWLSVLKTKLAAGYLAPEGKITLICEFEKFLTKTCRKI